MRKEACTPNDEFNLARLFDVGEIQVVFEGADRATEDLLHRDHVLARHVSGDWGGQPNEFDNFTTVKLKHKPIVTDFSEKGYRYVVTTRFSKKEKVPSTVIQITIK